MMEAKLRELLARWQKQTRDDPDRVPSAVIIPLYKKQGHYYIVFIKRTEAVKEHKGQISFPGGTRETGDKTLLDTALRECYEEIGLRPEDIDVLGELDDEITTTSNYVVAPFVGMIPWPYRFSKNDDEVDEILEFPITELMDRRCLQPDTEFLNGKTIDSFTYHVQGRVIWGATARILNRLLDICNQAMTE
jgi:8-oxo-dGTP pyrophosphatase MutT (NUDIX family)